MVPSDRVPVPDLGTLAAEILLYPKEESLGFDWHLQLAPFLPLYQSPRRPQRYKFPVSAGLRDWRCCGNSTH